MIDKYTAMCKILPLLSMLLFLAACPLENCDSPTGTEATGETTTSVKPTPLPKAPSRVDRQPVMGSHLVGYTAFSDVGTYDADLGYETLAAFNGQYIVRKLTYMRDRGYNLPRVGAQTDGWCGNDAFFLPCGVPIFSPEWRENLIGFLELSARVDGVFVQLIPTFTHKGNTGGKAFLVRLTREVVKIVRDGNFKHVIWEAFNEFQHPITRDGGNLRVQVLKAVLRELPHPRGTDLPSRGEGDDWRGSPDVSTVSDALGLMDYVAYHPSRNPEPTVRAYRRTINRSRGKIVLWDETVAWINQAEVAMLGGLRKSGLFTQGTQEEMDRQVRRQMDTICQAGGSYSFHALWLFAYDERLDWAPKVTC